jgi:hypothetical protein
MGTNIDFRHDTQGNLQNISKGSTLSDKNLASPATPKAMHITYSKLNGTDTEN